ncbi:hypothetical protein VP01_1307g2 [Puccinia sorghi]|uniref:Uncharacterized protein n=1 Tax=Puccinia sorghi TaxID=27349 RepID=A0A0L6VN14_9BASI|nr:hypothetical protein VP01_1307g2 [Puccinia sorghi]
MSPIEGLGNDAAARDPRLEKRKADKILKIFLTTACEYLIAHGRKLWTSSSATERRALWTPTQPLKDTFHYVSKIMPGGKEIQSFSAAPTPVMLRGVVKVMTAGEVTVATTGMIKSDCRCVPVLPDRFRFHPCPHGIIPDFFNFHPSIKYYGFGLEDRFCPEYQSLPWNFPRCRWQHSPAHSTDECILASASTLIEESVKGYTVSQYHFSLLLPLSLSPGNPSKILFLANPSEHKSIINVKTAKWLICLPSFLFSLVRSNFPSTIRFSYSLSDMMAFNPQMSLQSARGNCCALLLSQSTPAAQYLTEANAARLLSMMLYQPPCYTSCTTIQKIRGFFCTVFFPLCYVISLLQYMNNFPKRKWKYVCKIPGSHLALYMEEHTKDLTCIAQKASHRANYFLSNKKTDNVCKVTINSVKGAKVPLQ